MSGYGGEERSARGELILYSTEDGRADIQFPGGTGDGLAHSGPDGGTVRHDEAERQPPHDEHPGRRGSRAVSCQGILDTCLGRQTVPDEDLQPRCHPGRRVPVRSPRGVQFRRWATTVLREYLFKDYAMDDERLKDPDRDYFDELLERIRDIRRELMTLADWDWVLDRLLAGNELSFHV